MTNKHHILWERKSYSSNWQNKLRNNQYLVVDIDIRLHNEIHNSMKNIPVPKGSSCKMANNELNRLLKYNAIKESDPLSMRLELLIFIFDYQEPSTTKALRRQLEIVKAWEWEQFVSKLP